MAGIKGGVFESLKSLHIPGFSDPDVLFLDLV